jgi:hypothetical protein
VPQVTDRRFYPQASNIAPLSASAALGNGNLRVAPGYIATPVTITQLGSEITAIGDVGSTLLIAVYGTTTLNGQMWPGALVSSGAILGDSATVQEVDVADFTLSTGWYWFGGVVQGVTVAQPTVRTLAGAGVPGLYTNSLPATTGSNSGYVVAGVTGAAPNPFSASFQGSAGSVPRIHLRVA